MQVGRAIRDDHQQRFPHPLRILHRVSPLSHSLRAIRSESDSNPTLGSARCEMATGFVPFSMTNSAPARTRSRIEAKSLAASAPQM
jgi:hypothetical protein